MKKETPTSIRVKKETIKRLRKISRYGESYNDTINRILDRYRPIKHETWRDEDQEIIEEPPKKRRIIVQKPAKIIVGKPTKTNVEESSAEEKRVE